MLFGTMGPLPACCIAQIFHTIIPAAIRGRHRDSGDTGHVYTHVSQMLYLLLTVG